jgi:hypothetical protein
MATITGSLRTWFGGSLTDRSPFIRFIPSGVGIQGNGIYSAATRDHKVFEEGGQFSIELDATVGKRPECWLEFEIHYFSTTGQQVRKDYPDVRLYIPDGNGTYTFDEVTHGVSNPFLAWVQLDAPMTGPGVKYWLETNPDNIEDPRNTGFLYEWS